jgi:hypothetical protein
VLPGTEPWPSSPQPSHYTDNNLTCKYNSGDEARKDEMGGACTTYARDGICLPDVGWKT